MGKLPPKTMKVQYYDEWSDMLFAEYEITQEERDGLLAITDDVVYKHLKQSIGKTAPSPCGADGYIPPLVVGRIKIHIHLNYFLWKLRGGNPKKKHPMTEEEYNRLMDDGVADIWADFDTHPIYEITDIRIDAIANEIHNLVVE